MTRARRPSVKYRFKLKWPVNGRIARATIEAYRGKALVDLEKADVVDGDQLRKAAERLASRLECDADQVLKTLKALVTKTYPKAKAEHESHAAAPPPLGLSEQLLALADGQDYWHAPDGRAYATVAIGAEADPRRATYPLRGRDFRTWLSGRYWRTTGKSPPTQALQDALGTLEGRAIHDGPTRTVHVRVAGDASRMWLDLGMPCWRAVVIDAEGWRLVDAPPVRFLRPRGLLPLPLPERSDHVRLDDLRDHINVPPEYWPLLVAWLVQSLWPVGPYPLLVLHGEQGSAKTFTARLIRDLIDPSAAPLRSVPRDERDLVIAASNGWVLALDNVSAVSDWMSDALCRLATGGGYATRELYSDSEETIIEATRPVIITSIEGLPGRPDLIDRAVLLEMPHLGSDARRSERELLAAWQRDRPALLGALLDIVSASMRELPGVTLPRLPRMADYALLGTAVERAMGWPAETVADAYRDNIAAASSAALESSLLVGPIQSLLDASGGKWEGTCQALLSELRQRLDEPGRPPRGWPPDARRLSGQLRRLAPALRRAGIAVEMGRAHAGRTVTLSRQQAA